MAATHFGNCQICGREHKVTGVHISKHGYTVRNGWQQGACYGSEGKPIQLSCDLIEGAVAAAHGYIFQARAEIAALAVSPLDDEGKIVLVQHVTLRNGSRIDIARVTVEMSDKGFPVAMNRGTVARKWDKRTTVEQALAEVASNRVSYLTHTIDEANESIAMMEKTLANWKPSELRPIPDSELNKVPLVHFSANIYGVKNAPRCAGSAMGAMRSRAPVTTEREKVTCPRWV